MTTRRRIKRLHYRAQVPLPLRAHQDHWADFQWEAGPVIVSYAGRWGEVQVWAASEEEGRRVVAHACEIAGIPLTGPNAGEWVVTVATGGRVGKPGTFQVPVVEGFPAVTKREGSSGPAWVG